MKKLIFSLTVILLYQTTFAQEPDSTIQKVDTAKVDVPKEVPVVAEPEANTAQSQPSTPGITPKAEDTSVIVEQPESPEQSTEASEAQSQPRIIYYQSTPEPKYETRYRSKTRSRRDIKTIAGTMSHSGGFGALSFRSTEFRDETMVLAGVRGGWIINRTLGIGVEGHGIIPTAKFSDIDPNGDVIALGGYGGMFLELIFFSNTVVHITFPTSAGAGWLGYNDDWENDNADPNAPNGIIDEDVFWYIEPGANLELNISRSFRMDFGISKRFTQDLELVNTDTKGFESLNYYVTLKVGSF